MRQSASVADEPLCGLLSSHPYSSLPCGRLSQALLSRVTGLESDKKFECGMALVFFKASRHLLSVVFKDIGAATVWFVTEATIPFGQ